MSMEADITVQAIVFSEANNMDYCEASTSDVKPIEEVIRSLIIDIYTPKAQAQ